MPGAQEQLRVRRLILPFSRDDDTPPIQADSHVLHGELDRPNGDYRAEAMDVAGEDDCGGAQVITGGIENPVPKQDAKGGKEAKGAAEGEGDQEAKSQGDQDTKSKSDQDAEADGQEDNAGGRGEQKAGGREKQAEGNGDKPSGQKEAKQAGAKASVAKKPGESYPGASRVQQTTGELMVALQEAKDALTKEMEANLTQLKTVLKETQRIAKEMEAVLNEVKNEGSPEEMSMGRAPWDPPGQKKQAKGKGKDQGGKDQSGKAKGSKNQEPDPWDPDQNDDRKDEWQPPGYH